MNKKTEILITEPLDGLPKQFIKDNIKIFGYYYGNDATNKSFEEKFKKMSDGKQKWSTRKNLFDKAFIINTYILSQIQYIIKLYPINNYYNKKKKKKKKKTTKKLTNIPNMGKTT